MKRELKIFAWIAGAFLFAYLVPFSHPKVQRALAEAFLMLRTTPTTTSSPASSPPSSSPGRSPSSSPRRR